MEQEHFGFWDRILRIDLTQQSIRVEQPGERLFRIYMGGRNLALHYLLNELKPGVDPLGPENKLIFMTSVVTGAPIAGQGRHTAASISPLTGGLADSQCGGWWGAELKFAGYDGIILEGRSPKPVYILIEDENVQILPAEDLWGKTTGEVEDILKSVTPKRRACCRSARQAKTGCAMPISPPTCATSTGAAGWGR